MSPKSHKKAKLVVSEKHVHFYKRGGRLIYWMTLLILAVCNFIVTLTLIPFVLVLDALNIYLVSAGLGLVFGLLFNTLVTDIEHLRPRHHLFAAILIPVLALVNFYLISIVITKISSLLLIEVLVNPMLLGLVYCALFIMPYAASSIFTESLIKSEHF